MAVRLLLLSVSTLLLAACQSGETSDPTPSQTMMPVEPDGGIGDGATPLPGSTDRADAGTGRDTIPVNFRGVWDYVDGTCARNSDLRMEIDADTVEFYESVGQVAGVLVESEDSIVVNLDMSGEGERWMISRRFTLSNNGQVLTQVNADGEQPTTPMPRKKCAS